MNPELRGTRPVTRLHGNRSPALLAAPSSRESWMCQQDGGGTLRAVLTRNGQEDGGHQIRQPGPSERRANPSRSSPVRPGPACKCPLDGCLLC
ncbi:hypothetical protein chiPu_0002945 [Chiloscyllium punctatum]|uniref:Uncharacterized protein n=1 Tax=Chiloscyllium punctatum TaxID=137246 RepID=A0A401S2A5_CHIPU|nr:hypothetical protein [Chiloscyllium punctatum]